MFPLFKSHSRVKRLVRNQIARQNRLSTLEQTPYTGPLYTRHGRVLGS